MRVSSARWILALLVLAAAAWSTRSNLGEAFGAGPPYYSRTTNMDKWEDPVPMVVAGAPLITALDLLYLAGAVVLIVRSFI